MADNGVQLPLSLASYNNQSLFSDHYLSEILFRSKTWENAVPEGRQFLTWLRTLYTQEKNQLPHYKESQLEDNWFKPIFTRLGHTWEGQAAIPGLKGSTKKPDFAFFPDDATRKTAVSHQNTPLYTQSALAIGEVKQWEINLSKKTGNQPTFDDQNPMYQIDTYLTLTGLEWGILSNGRFWRLLHKNSSRTLETYFEIDLQAALQQPEDKKADAIATYFWLFFNQRAFRPDEHGRLFLNEALEESRAYAIALEADLRDNAYRSLEQLIIGFFAGDATLDHHQESHRTQVYQNSLYLLYRLLFLFYGESRALLPMHNATYKNEYSLQQFAKGIDAQRNDLDKLPSTGRRNWNRLRELFHLISGADAQLNADLGVPRYNGGLFDPQQHPFLEKHFVGDRYLARAIDYLAYRRVREEGQFRGYQAVDYRTLDVRQLGSIYEGLLEYKVAIATEEMVTVRKGGVEVWVTAVNRGKDKVLDHRKPGDLYLATDKGERKATGSYYTPDYIVEYIVANTLGPLVERSRDQVKTQMSQAESLDTIARQQQGASLFVTEILGLNVLDPAMGSGHFLVEATNYLARVLATDEYVQVQNVGSSGSLAGSETDLLYWKRRVVEACIYGVDKNPMAVELAKLSLWLKTAASDKPLSFLDHHLRHGDSLVGAWLDDLRHAPGSSSKAIIAGQQNLFDESTFTHDVGLAVNKVSEIENLPTNSIEDVYTKEAAWLVIQQTYLERWRQLADLWVSYYFGNTYTPEEYRALAAQVQGQPSLMNQAQATQFLTHPSVTHNDYCHWQLAFPEVFFDKYGRSWGNTAGFDAVIGNPPYVRQEHLTPYKRYYKQRFISFTGAADLYLYFYEQGVELLQIAGRISYISSGTFAKTNSAKPFREWLPNHAHIESLIDFGENQPFEGAEMVRPSIVVMKKGPQAGNFLSMFMDGTTIWSPLEKAMEEHGFECDSNALKLSEWTFQAVEKQDIANKLFAQGVPLEEFIGEKMFYGIKTGLNEAFYIDSQTRQQLISQHPSSNSMIKPMLRGANLRPWYQISEGDWLIFSRQGTNIDNYPAIKAYLQKFQTALEPKPDDWNARKSWPGRKEGSYQWYELQDTVAYHAEFEKPKIIWSDITKLPRFSWDVDGHYVNQKCYIITEQHPALLAILQSRVTWFSISQICTPLRLRAGLWQYQVLAQFVARLPIPDMSEAVRDKLGVIAMSVTDLARKRYQLHQQIGHRIRTDLGTTENELNNALTTWWGLDFNTFRNEIKKVFKRDIPLKERHDWELYLADAQQKHQQLTAQIITHEIELNQQVYELFHLTADEIQIIEESTKYKYGEM